MRFDYSFINLSVLVKIEKIANYLVKLHYLNYMLVCFFKNLLISLNHNPLYFFHTSSWNIALSNFIMSIDISLIIPWKQIPIKNWMFLQVYKRGVGYCCFCVCSILVQKYQVLKKDRLVPGVVNMVLLVRCCVTVQITILSR